MIATRYMERTLSDMNDDVIKDVIKNAGANNLVLAEWCEKIMLARCKACEFCRDTVSKNGWEYKGCYSDPYNVRWICSIKECPRGRVVS